MRAWVRMRTTLLSTCSDIRERAQHHTIDAFRPDHGERPGPQCARGLSKKVKALFSRLTRDNFHGSFQILHAAGNIRISFGPVRFAVTLEIHRPNIETVARKLVHHRIVAVPCGSSANARPVIPSAAIPPATAGAECSRKLRRDGRFDMIATSASRKFSSERWGYNTLPYEESSSMFRTKRISKTKRFPCGVQTKAALHD
jgi:hypothetical protein